MFRLVFALAVLCVGARANVCDPVNQIPGGKFNSDCTDPEEPYCRMVDDPRSLKDPTYVPNFQCRACLDECDCDGLNEFCSKEPGENFGTCKEFDSEKLGEACLPFSLAEMSPLFDFERANKFESTLKCATFYTGYVNTTTQSDVLIDQAGACVEGKCMLCSTYRSGGGSSATTGLKECKPDDGLKRERTCVYPQLTSSNMGNTHNNAWWIGTYQENTNSVWWAIFFTFFMLLLCCQCAQTVAIFKQ